MELMNILKLHFFLFFFGIIFVSLRLNSAEQPQINPYKCKPTPFLAQHFPEADKIGKTNNLWRKTGLATPAYGYPIYITGKILDVHCVPIAGAKVQIWQADARGNFSTELDAKVVEPYFSSSGSITTNNKGEYSFITVFPGIYRSQPPHIKFRVTHHSIGVLETKMFFEGYLDNMQDTDFSDLEPRHRALLVATTTPYGFSRVVQDGALQFYFNLVLERSQNYRQY